METRPRNEEEAIHFLIARLPELQPLYQQHVDFNGELLPYILFEGDFTRWFTAAVRGGEPQGQPRRFAQAVETLMDTQAQPPSDDPVWNLAAVAFVESLVMGGEDDVIDRASSWFGPATKRGIDYMLRDRDRPRRRR